VCKASLSPGTERSAVHAFELVLGVRARNGTGGTNDLDAEFRYLQPGYVRVKTVKSNKEVGRGPGGDWLVDGARNEKIKLSVGREYAEDRRQLDDWAAVARIFVSLTDPRSLRLAALDVLKSAPLAIPAQLAKRAGELAWLRVRSPDFKLVGASPASSIFRGSLGWDRKTGLVELALVEEDAPDDQLRASARLVEMREPTASGGFLDPKRIHSGPAPVQSEQSGKASQKAAGRAEHKRQQIQDARRENDQRTGWQACMKGDDEPGISGEHSLRRGNTDHRSHIGGDQHCRSCGQHHHPSARDEVPPRPERDGFPR
jgi:hypothetical protein